MKKIKKVILVFINVIYFISLFTLLFSYLAPFISPELFWPLAFLGLAYPVILVVNILFLLWWIIRWKKFYWLSLLCILLGWGNMTKLFRFSKSSTSALSSQKEKKESLKILSFNVRLFDLYQWTHNKETRNKIFSLLKEEQPDIVCFQEFFQGDSGYFETYDTLMKILHARDAQAEYTVTLRKKHHWGIATFSKYPMLNKGKLHFNTKSNNLCIFSDLLIGSDTVRIYNIHLQSVRLGYARNKFSRELQYYKVTEEASEAIKNILQGLKMAFLKRTEQSDAVAKHISRSPYPVIVCGDFNDTPFSYTYRTFSTVLEDAFMESGNGTGNTYTDAFFSHRIDYIFHSREFSAYDFRVLPDKLSDHYPIACRLKKEK